MAKYPRGLCRSSRPEVFCKKGVLQKFRQIHRKTPVPVGLRPATLLKKRLTQVFFCEFCEISKNTFFFIDHLWWLLLFMAYSIEFLMFSRGDSIKTKTKASKTSLL